jgi:hypothetical protein
MQTTVYWTQRSPFEVDGDTYNISGLCIEPSNAIQGEELMKRNDGSGGNTARQLIH